MLTVQRQMSVCMRVCSVVYTLQRSSERYKTKFASRESSLDIFFAKNKKRVDDAVYRDYSVYKDIHSMIAGQGGGNNVEGVVAWRLADCKV